MIVIAIVIDSNQECLSFKKNVANIFSTTINTFIQCLLGNGYCQLLIFKNTHAVLHLFVLRWIPRVILSRTKTWLVFSSV